MFGSDMGDIRGDWIGMGPMRASRGSVRRGEVREAILAVLARERMHGYRIIQAVSDQSGGQWRPSAGSVYPTLQLLEDEGLVESKEADGRRVYSLTETGRAAADEARARRESEAPTPSATPTAGTARSASEPDTPAEVRDSLFKLNAAVAQAAQVGTPETVARLKALLADARKATYRLLSEEDEPDNA